MNVNGNIDGELNNGILNGELEIALPTDHYFVGKIKRDLKIVDGIGAGNLNLVFDLRDNKNTPGRKLEVTGILNNINFKKKFVDVQYNIVGDSGQGKNINIDLHLVRKPQDEKINVELLVCIIDYIIFYSISS